MVVEDSQKSTITDEQNPSRVDNDDDDLEDGEILEDADDAASAASKPPSAFLRKPHPLENSWTFWFDNPSAKSKQAAWGSSIRPIYTFSTVEEFWSIYNNIHHPSKLGVGADFHCFKHKIEPKWEDPICANGGKWTMTFQRGNPIPVGCIRNRQDKISIWTKNASNEAAQMSIGKQWKEFLDYNEPIGFIFHEDAKKHERSAKNKYAI
ncbi:hypothetical protein ACSQ67_012872 [Phaseolus vulgaris]